MANEDRLHNLEDAFIRVDSTFKIHMEHEEQAFARLHSDIGKLVDKIDNFTEVLSKNNESIKDQIYASSEKYFVAQNTFSEYKLKTIHDIDEKIKDSRRELLKFISMGGSLILALVTMAGWAVTHLQGI